MFSHTTCRHGIAATRRTPTVDAMASPPPDRDELRDESMTARDQEWESMDNEDFDRRGERERSEFEQEDDRFSDRYSNRPRGDDRRVPYVAANKFAPAPLSLIHI